MHLLTRIPFGVRNILLERLLLALEKILLSLQNSNFSWALLGCLITVFFTLLIPIDFSESFSIVFADNIASSTTGGTTAFATTGTLSMLGPQNVVCGHTLAKSNLILLLVGNFLVFLKSNSTAGPCLRVVIALIQELFK